MDKKHVMKKLNSILLLVLCVPCFAQQNNISKEKYHWGTVLQDTAWGYAGVVKTGNTLYFSGVVGPGDFPTQVQTIYTAIGNNLKKFGATFQNVVKENLYTTNMDSMKYYDYLRKPFYKGDYPASTWTQVSRLFMADRSLEVEVIAELPEKPVLPEWPGDMLTGTWGMETKNGMLYETWEKVNDNLLRGKSYRLNGNDTLVSERVELRKDKTGVWYVPTVTGQNAGKPVTFKQTLAMGNFFVFENPQHDFPKRVAYEIVSEETLRAWIDGGEGSTNRRNFIYKRIK